MFGGLERCLKAPQTGGAGAADSGFRLIESDDVMPPRPVCDRSGSAGPLSFL